MSRHWRPEGKIVSVRAVRGSSFGVAGAPQRLSAGAKAGLMLVGAVCLGLSAGLYQAFAPIEPVAVEAKIEWDEAQGVPTRAPDAEDADGEQRAIDQDRPSTSSGRTDVRGTSTRRSSGRTEGVPRGRFGLCHSGGGTNCVVDGDTFYLGGAKVRIAGIDAPETHPPRCAQEAQLGEAATTKLRDLLNSGAVTLTPLGTSIEHFAQSGTLSEGRGRDRDQYGRLLRNVAVDGADVGEAMVSAGVARDYGNGRRSWC